LEVREGEPEFGESVVSVGLQERHVAFGVGVMTDDVWDLFEDEDDAHRGEESFDDAGGNECGDGALSEGAEDCLEATCDNEGGEECFVGAEGEQLRVDDDG
jgi:hypothetical protein